MRYLLFMYEKKWTMIISRYNEVHSDSDASVPHWHQRQSELQWTCWWSLSIFFIHKKQISHGLCFISWNTSLFQSDQCPHLQSMIPRVKKLNLANVRYVRKEKWHMIKILSNYNIIPWGHSTMQGIENSMNAICCIFNFVLHGMEQIVFVWETVVNGKYTFFCAIYQV